MKERRRQQHFVSTCTPNMEEIKHKAKPKKEKKRVVTKRLFDASEQDVPSGPSQRERRNVKNRLHIYLNESDADIDEFLGDNNDDEDCPCIYCNDLYSRSKPGESWLRCIKTHTYCAQRKLKFLFVSYVLKFVIFSCVYLLYM